MGLMHHVLISGHSGVGKTTLMKNLIAKTKKHGVPCNGFVTEEIRDSKKNGELMDKIIVSTDDESVSLLKPVLEIYRLLNLEANPRGPFAGNFAVDVASFDSILRKHFPTVERRGGVLFVDEISKAHYSSSYFKNHLTRLLDSSTNKYIIIATRGIVNNSSSFLTAVSSKRNVKKFTVSRLNRTEVEDKLSKYILECHKLFGNA